MFSGDHCEPVAHHVPGFVGHLDGSNRVAPAILLTIKLALRASGEIADGALDGGFTLDRML